MTQRLTGCTLFQQDNMSGSWGPQNQRVSPTGRENPAGISFSQLGFTARRRLSAGALLASLDFSEPGSGRSRSRRSVSRWSGNARSGSRRSGSRLSGDGRCCSLSRLLGRLIGLLHRVSALLGHMVRDLLFHRPRVRLRAASPVGCKSTAHSA